MRFLPKAVDIRAPQVKQLLLKVNSEHFATFLPNKENKVRISQKFPLFVLIDDAGNEKNSRRGIYKLEWKLKAKIKR